MRALQHAVALTVAAILCGCAEMPPRAPVDGQINAVSSHDIREIRAAAQSSLHQSGSAEPIYSVEILGSDLAYVWYGKRRVHYDDREEALVVRRVHDHWRATGEGVVSVSNIPVG
jgi:hypothetical protein